MCKTCSTALQLGCPPPQNWERIAPEQLVRHVPRVKLHDVVAFIKNHDGHEWSPAAIEPYADFKRKQQ
jgi:hypothetical protein